jgi:hypothetical protein
MRGSGVRIPLAAPLFPQSCQKLGVGCDRQHPRFGAVAEPRRNQIGDCRSPVSLPRFDSRPHPHRALFIPALLHPSLQACVRSTTRPDASCSEPLRPRSRDGGSAIGLEGPVHGSVLAAILSGATGLGAAVPLAIRCAQPRKERPLAALGDNRPERDIAAGPRAAQAKHPK